MAKEIILCWISGMGVPDSREPAPSVINAGKGTGRKMYYSTSHRWSEVQGTANCKNCEDQ